MGDSQDEQASMIGMKEIKVLNSQTYRKVVKERRFMAAATLLTTICAILFFVAVATTGWLVVRLEYVDGSVKTCYIGIWGEYVVSSRAEPVDNGEQSQSLDLEGVVADAVRGNSHPEVFINHFPYPPKEVIRLIRNIDLPHFYRTQAVFSVFALVLMFASVACAVYSLSFQHRYIYKRLTAGLQAISAMCVLIVIEVMIYSVKEWHLVLATNTKAPQQQKFDDTDDYLAHRTTYSYSTVIAWFVFAIYVVAAVIFVVGSRKRKGSQSATEDFEVADRPMVIGRG